jgi:hypothetical protein
MSDNEGEGSGRGQEKGETSELGMIPPKHLVMGQEDMAKAWKIWVCQFDWYAAASGSTLKGAEVQINYIEPWSRSDRNLQRVWFVSSGRKSRGNDSEEIRGTFYA